MRAKWGERTEGRYEFVDAFHPAAHWFDADVIGIDQGISVLMAENPSYLPCLGSLYTQSDSERAMQLAGSKVENKNQLRLAIFARMRYK